MFVVLLNKLMENVKNVYHINPFDLSAINLDTDYNNTKNLVVT